MYRPRWVQQALQKRLPKSRSTRSSGQSLSEREREKFQGGHISKQFRMGRVTETIFLYVEEGLVFVQLRVATAEN